MSQTLAMFIILIGLVGIGGYVYYLNHPQDEDKDKENTFMKKIKNKLDHAGKEDWEDYK